MPNVLDSYPSDIARLVAQQTSLLDRWVRQRQGEEPDLDRTKLRHALGGYIEWSAHVVQAAGISLKVRRWTGMLAIVEAMARDGIAKSTATPRADGTLTVLSQAFYQNAFVLRLSTDETPLVDGDIKEPLQTGFVLLGEARGKKLAEAARARMLEVIETLMQDMKSAGDAAMRHPLPPVPPLGQITSGSRDLTSTEARLVGRWIYQEFYTSGGFSMRSELHMILLGDGHVVRTTRGVSSSTFHDASGNWTGYMDANSGGLEPGERGRWKADGRLVTLDMEDASVYEYGYTLEGSKLLTRNTSGGQERFWTRSGI